MTDDLRRDLFGDTGRDQGLDAPLESDDPTAGLEGQALRTDDTRLADRKDMDSGQREPNPLLREGADAADAADIEDPDNML
jgi:hypothetical protein